MQRRSKTKIGSFMTVNPEAFSALTGAHSRDSERVAAAFERYLEEIDAADSVSGEAQRERLLRAQAELLFQLRGGGHCAECDAAVRHVLRVRVWQQDGSSCDFECLCTRCLVAHESAAKAVGLGAPGATETEMVIRRYALPNTAKAA
jgi:hypothetical protein